MSLHNEVESVLKKLHDEGKVATVSFIPYRGWRVYHYTMKTEHYLACRDAVCLLAPTEDGIKKLIDNEEK